MAVEAMLFDDLIEVADADSQQLGGFGPASLCSFKGVEAKQFRKLFHRFIEVPDTDARDSSGPDGVEFQVSDLHQLALTGQYSATNLVFQFSNISRPGVFREEV